MEINLMNMNKLQFGKPLGMITLIGLSLSLISSGFGGETRTVTLGGEAGAAEKEITDRLNTPPFISLAWLRADLTGERVSEHDNDRNSNLRRPFKAFSGDISGRYIEIMAMDAENSSKTHTLMKELIGEAVKHQRKGGYFCSAGEVDWNNALDEKRGPNVFYPALWGNARMLCGLVEAYRADKDPVVLSALKKLGDFYVDTLPLFTDPSRKSEYVQRGWYASNYIICYFPAMEGLVNLYSVTGDKKYLDAAKYIDTAATMAKFFEQFDVLPVDHAHGMLCNHVGLLRLYEVTDDKYYLNRVEDRWQELVEDGYIQPPGGPLEKCHVFYKRDEGCGLTDWFRLNLKLAKVTGKSKYWDMAERVFRNHFLQNQSTKGGHGHRHMIGDKKGIRGFDSKITESTWCCIYHGRLAFLLMKDNLFTQDDKGLTCNFPLDFTSSTDDQEIVSSILPAENEGEIYRQQIRIKRGAPKKISMRVPHWATSVSAVDTDGKRLKTKLEDGFCRVPKTVSEATFIYRGGVFAEDRHCVRLPNGPKPGQPYTLWYGPKLLVTEENPPPATNWPVSIKGLEKAGFIPLSAKTRSKKVYFVFDFVGPES